MISQASESNELFRVAKGCSWQCDLTNRVYLQFQETTAAFRMRDFFAFHRKVNAVNIHDMIYNLSDAYDFEIIEAPQQGVTLQLGLCELIQLRDLLDGTRFALKLNSLLHEALGEVSRV